jgi:hypothetical protein
MDAFGMHAFLPSPFATPATDEGCTSELHQPLKPQPPEQFRRHQFVVKSYLAGLHPQQQGDLAVQR